MAYRLSNNSLKVYEECERCFWYVAKKRIARPSGPFPSLPHGMDLALKRYYDGYRARGETPSFPGVEEVGAKLYTGPELATWRQTKGLCWIDSKGNSLTGGLDDVIIVDGLLSAMDNKTRSSAPPSFDEASPPKKPEHIRMVAGYRNQLSIYHFLLDKMGQKVNSFGFLNFWHSPEVDDYESIGKGLVAMRTDLVKVALHQELVQTLFEGAIKVLNKRTVPKSDKDCAYCAWTKKTF